MEAAKASQVARFKAHPEQLNDLHRCDWDKFDGDDAGKLRDSIACQNVSELKAQRERINSEWHRVECATIENCKLTIRQLRERIEGIRRLRATFDLDSDNELTSIYIAPELYSPCAITLAACDPDPSTADAFRDIEQYYRKQLRERDERLSKAIELLNQKQQENELEDGLLNAIDR